MPTHHLHISSGFLFIFAIFIFAIVALVLYWRYEKREQERLNRRDAAYVRSSFTLPAATSHEARPSAYEAGISYRDQGPWGTRTPGYAPVAPAPAPVVAQPVYQSAVAPVVMAHNPASDMLVGMAMGSMIANAGHHHDTVVVHDTYVDSSPSYDSGITYDSGSSYDSSDSSGGFDASW